MRQTRYTMDAMLSKSLQWILAAAVGAILFSTGYLVGLQQNGADLTKAYTAGLAKGTSAIDALWGEEGTDTNTTENGPELFSAQILELTDNGLVVKSDSWEEGKTIVITQLTQFFERVQKDAALVSREQAAYQARVNANPQLAIAPPELFTENSISADDFRAGDFVEIIAPSGEASDALLASRVTRVTPAPSLAE